MYLYGSRSSPFFLIHVMVCLLLLHCITIQGLQRTRRFRGTTTRRTTIRRTTIRRTTTRRTTIRTTRRKSSTPKITASTPLAVTSYTSSIIRSQALNPRYQSSFRTRFITGAVSGALVYSYLYSANRAYSGVYTPYETSHLLIPQRRALRIAREEYRIQTAEGIDCTSGTLREDYADSIKNVTTKIAYRIPQRNFETIVSHQSASNVSLADEKAVESYPVYIKVYSEYKRSLIVESSEINCTEIVCNVKAYMIRMYDTNPNYNLAERLEFSWYKVLLLLLPGLYLTKG